ncbi:hypothetical protein [Streptomyces mirabilis]|uniref:hypothetical protein n=1 Tax=Streptomyces mirabilis TaxID=68239 RepID=UPI0036CCD4FE
MGQSDRYTVHPVSTADGGGAWGVRDDDTWEIESRHMSRSDAEARAEAKNNGKTRA